jgi:hypothetical protein
MSHTSRPNPGAHEWVLRVANRKLLDPTCETIFTLAKAGAPVRSGELVSEMYNERVNDRTRRIGSHSNHTLVNELGSRPHLIESHGDYPLRNRETGQVFGRVVHHPGTLAQPFLRPALYSQRA